MVISFIDCLVYWVGIYKFIDYSSVTLRTILFYIALCNHIIFSWVLRARLIFVLPSNRAGTYHILMDYLIVWERMWMSMLSYLLEFFQLSTNYPWFIDILPASFTCFSCSWTRDGEHGRCPGEDTVNGRWTIGGQIRQWTSRHNASTTVYEMSRKHFDPPWRNCTTPINNR